MGNRSVTTRFIAISIVDYSMMVLQKIVKGLEESSVAKEKLKKSALDGRGQFNDAPRIHDRPIAAEKRSEIGQKDKY